MSHPLPTWRRILDYGLKHPADLWGDLAFQRVERPSSGRHIFVLGPPRSGTTLVRQILSAHPAISCPDFETYFFSYRRRAYLLQGLSREAQEFGLTAEEAERTFSKCSNVVECFDEFARLHLAKSGAGRFLEKTPEHAFRLPFLVESFPAAQFVFVVRDPRDGLLSARRLPAAPHSAQQFVAMWKRAVQRRFAVARHANILDVRYEDLCRDPEKTASKIMMFLGECYKPSQLDPAAYGHTREATKGHTRLQDTISTKTVGQWRTDLAKREAGFVYRKTRRFMALLGYTHNQLEV